MILLQLADGCLSAMMTPVVIEKVNR